MRISILIPCWNEGKSIKKCLNSCLSQTRKADEIVVVNDASTDNSLKILRSFGKKIKLVNLKQRSGNKSHAQEQGLKHVTGDIFIATDADTLLDKNFVAEIEAEFKKDKSVAAVAGYIRSLKHNWLTALREIDYTIGQKIHKNAQSSLGALLVIPGAAAAFRTSTFKKHITFDHDTVTEDLDFTYKFHRNKLKIKFSQTAIVYTQDPADIKSYIRQMRRWYAGGWQNLLKHRQVFSIPTNSLELSLSYGEGLLFSFLLFLLPIMNPQLLPLFLVFLLATGLVFALYAALVTRRLDLLLFSPLYSFITVLHTGIFLSTFIQEVIFRRRNLTWLSADRRTIK